MKNGTILDFTTFELIKSFEGYGEKFRFNKFMYLLNKELKNDGIDIKLPYCWYRYGIVVEVNNRSLDYLSLLNFKEIPYKCRSKIIKNIAIIKKKYHYKKTDEINAEIYKEAPYKFQDDFREILKIVKFWKNGNKTLDNYFDNEPSYLLNLAKKALIEFPPKDFDDIYPLFLEWENYITQLIEINYPIKKIASFIDKFWFTFSKKLRILTEVNIDQTLINEWKKDYERDLLNLEDYLFNFSFEFYSNYYIPPKEYSKSEETINMDCYVLSEKYSVPNELNQPEFTTSLKHSKSLEELHKIASKTIWEQ